MAAYDRATDNLFKTQSVIMSVTIRPKGGSRFKTILVSLWDINHLRGFDAVSGTLKFHPSLMNLALERATHLSDI